MRLLVEGLPIQLDPDRDVYRPDPSGVSAFSDETDILVGGEYRIEVKSSSYSFTSPEDWPFPWGAYLWSKPRWDEAKVKPHAYVLYSEPTGGLLAVNGNSCNEWIVRTSHDHHRDDWPTEKLCAPRHLIYPFEMMVAALKRKYR